MEMNGDGVEHIVRFLERQEERLPVRVSNGMILIALREVRDEVMGVKRVLHGEKPDSSDGLVQRLQRLEAARALALWLLSPVVLAFLGALGALLFAQLSAR